jgi:hypothetical protein
MSLRQISTSSPLNPILSHKLALASLQLRVAASASGYGGGEGQVTAVAAASLLPSRGQDEGA